MSVGTGFVSPSTSAVEPASGEVLIEVSGVHKFFGKLQVLADVQLEILRGECVVLCGPSGSGKSTLLRAIAGLERIDRGEVRIDGCVRNSPRGGSLRQSKVAMVFQGEQLYPHMTVLDNILFAPLHLRRGSRDTLCERASSLLESVGLQEIADKYPHELSIGQQQRVAIVRCLALEPEVLLMDEPTSALDTSNVKQILSIIYRMRDQGLTMVLVTHETGLARMVADRIVCMEHGVVREVGLPQKMLLNPRSPVVRNLFGDTIHVISALDRILHTGTLNVGVFDLAHFDEPVVLQSLKRISTALACDLSAKLLSHRRPELDLRMGNIDLLLTVSGDDLSDGGLKRYPFVNGGALHINPLDSAWQRQLDILCDEHACCTPVAARLGT